MKTFKVKAAQGDLYFTRIAAPQGVKFQPSGNSRIVAHSETGHHHTMVVDAPGRLEWAPGTNPLYSFLRVIGLPARLEHQRSFDTHEPFLLAPGDYELRRQREWTPAGEKIVED